MTDFNRPGMSRFRSETTVHRHTNGSKLRVAGYVAGMAFSRAPQDVATAIHVPIQ